MVRKLRNGTVQRRNRLYSLAMWSAFDNTKFTFLRTQTRVEAGTDVWKPWLPDSMLVFSL